MLQPTHCGSIKRSEWLLGRESTVTKMRRDVVVIFNQNTESCLTLTKFLLLPTPNDRLAGSLGL